ncbi:MAG: CDGSH iron-sulfur domain-containing protein [Planctomycetaceae bacterium]
MEITIMDNGPLRATGEKLVIKDSTGKAYNLAGKPGVALCRCGHSANKPFCDGSHARQGFTSKCVAS